jgi:hypothetical protein
VPTRMRVSAPIPTAEASTALVLSASELNSRAVGFQFGWMRVLAVFATSKEDVMGRGGIIWTVVGILLIIALLIYIL